MLTTSTFEGLTSFLILRMWFGKAVEDFNRTIIEDGTGGPQLVADTSNGFTSMCPHEKLRPEDC